jgi:hypothetical protein
MNVRQLSKPMLVKVIARPTKAAGGYPQENDVSIIEIRLAIHDHS